ncbi:hypothetical protein BC831DRAFT_481009 [Entophlyctis helioformis]|nr:hypothetical protein BC831DRAFT_481009 [Entophlyctis helioformis]
MASSSSPVHAHTNAHAHTHANANDQSKPATAGAGADAGEVALPQVFERFASISERFAGLLSRNSFLVLFVLYMLGFFVISWAESGVREALRGKPVQTVDSRFSYSNVDVFELFYYLRKAGSDAYLLFLALEIPFSLAGSMLFASSANFVLKSLAHAEKDLDDRIKRTHSALANKAATAAAAGSNDAQAIIDEWRASKARKFQSKPHLAKLRTAFITTLPVLIAIIDILENVVLMAIALDYEMILSAGRKFETLSDVPLSLSNVALLLSFVAPYVTQLKWLMVRAAFAVTLLTSITGWLRVYIHRFYANEPLFGGSQDVFAKILKKPAGLARGRDVQQPRAGAGVGNGAGNRPTGELTNTQRKKLARQQAAVARSNGGKTA